jgi:esterase/lipase superfamily enzyme
MNRYLLLTAVAVLINYGCASTPQDAAASAPPAPEEALVNVWYATDRNRTEADNLKEFFGVERDELSYGICQVAIDLDESVSPLVDQTLWHLKSGEEPSSATELRRINPIEKSDFFAQMRKTLDASSEKSILLYIHGYMRSFQLAAREAARLAYEISYKGLPALYSWPSRDSLVNYIADVAGVDWSVANLREFLEDLTLETQGATIHVIAHSLGNRALLNALVQLREESEEHNLPWKFGEIVLLAPDFDRATFTRDIAPVLTNANSRITLYVSAVDIPLLASKMLSAYPRLGDGRYGPTVIPGIETIDATDAVGWVSGHTYFRRNVQVLSDLHYLIVNHMSAAERPTLRAVESPEGRYWKLPDLPEEEEQNKEE